MRSTSTHAARTSSVESSSNASTLGVARTSRQWSANDSSFTQTGWVQGERYNVDTLVATSTKLPPEVYDVRIAMVDTTGKPSIRRAIEGEDARLRYKLGTIQVLPSRRR